MQVNIYKDGFGELHLVEADKAEEWEGNEYTVGNLLGTTELPMNEEEPPA